MVTFVNERPAAVIFGLSGPELTPGERAFFADADPLGFILFQRNCRDPDQVRELVDDLRATVGRPDAPILIDQEGGRVQRLKPPQWRSAAPAIRFGTLYRRDPQRGLAATRLNARLIADDLISLGINVDCAPVLDLAFDDAHDVIGDRAFGATVDDVVALGEAFAEGLRAGGVLPIWKHIPGHGRAVVDSHLELPRVEASLAQLTTSCFAPFRRVAGGPLAQAAWAMTAHIVYPAIDDQPATQSSRMIGEIIRGTIGFDGLLLSDDLAMSALSGSFTARAEAALAAGCDLVLHCQGGLEVMKQVMSGVAPMTDAALRRLHASLDGLPVTTALDRPAALAELDRLLDGVEG